VRNITTNNPFLLRLGTKWPLNVPVDTGAIWWTSFQPLIHSHLLTAIRFLFQITERNGWIACYLLAFISWHEMIQMSMKPSHEHQITPAAFSMTQIHTVFC
jgi:hypothetical protein